MNDQGTVLTDADQRIWLDAFRVEDQANDSNSAIDKWTIRGGPGDGIDVVEIDNGRLCVSVLPTRGMGLWKARCDELQLGWDSPVNRPVHPALVRPGESGGAGWLGGFHELLARCGLAWHGPPGTDSIEGRPLTLHGRIANLPAHRVTTGIADDGRLWVRGEVDETALFGPCLRLDSTVSTTPGSNRLSLLDTVTNLAGTTADFEVLYHTNIGSPLLEPGSRLVASPRRVIPTNAHAATDIADWNVFAPPQAGYVEQCYFLDLAADGDGRALVVLHDAEARRGIALEFPTASLPCFTLWKNTVATPDGYVAGIEPSTDLPNPRDFERAQGRLMRLEPGETWSTHIDLIALTNRSEVAEAVDRVAAIHPADSVQLCESPLPEYCSAG